MKDANENYFELSQLALNVRAFINIDLGLEPNNYAYMADRRTSIKNESLKIIESIRKKQNNLNFLLNEH